MGYIKELRNLVGHKPVMMVSACALIIDDKNRLLLQLRKDNNYWGYPGGAVELFEKVEDAAKREILEETGLIINELELFSVESGEKRHYTYPNGDEVSIIEIVYVCNYFEGQLKIQKTEVIKQQFFEIDSLPENISPMNYDVIKMWLDKYEVSERKSIQNDKGEYL